jgi:deoxyribonuclease IV
VITSQIKLNSIKSNLVQSNFRTSQLKIGAHVSASGGVSKAIERVAKIDGNCVQVFTASPRSWRRPEIEVIASKEIVEKKIKTTQKECQVYPIITHAMYLVNLASTNQELLKNSQKVLKFDLEFDARVGGGGVVVHLGSHLGLGWEATKDQVATQISTILANSSKDSTLLIENSAGQNGKLCSDLSEVKWLLDQINSPKLGWCVDVCHAFAAGYWVGEQLAKLSQDQQQKIRLENQRQQNLLDAITDLDLWDKLSVIHVNGSRDPYGSGRDRHANLGEGELASSDIAYFLNDFRSVSKPMILEVPGFSKTGPDIKNIHLLEEIMRYNT